MQQVLRLLHQEWQQNDFIEHFRPGTITVVREENKVIGYSQIEDQGNQLYIRMLLLLLSTAINGGITLFM